MQWRNPSGNIPVTNCGVWGNALNNCLPENDDALPEGWASLREEYDFKRMSQPVDGSPRMGGR